MPSEVAERAGRLPVDLVDDLLEVVSDQRFEQFGEPRVEADAIECRLMVGRPLNQPHQGLIPDIPRNIVVEISVPKAAPMRDAFSVDLFQASGDLADLFRTEKAADDGISVPPILRQVRTNRA